MNEKQGRLMEKSVLYALLLALFAHVAFASSDDKIDESMISSGAISPKSAQEDANNLDKQSYAGLEDVFLDTKTITPNGKYMLLVFGKNGCAYCELLKKDIKQRQDLKNFIKQHYSAYYINISYSKMHEFKIGTKKKPREVVLSTSQLAQVYDVSSTPTIVLADSDGKTIYELPGYMPSKQFLAVLEFIGNGLYKGITDDKVFVEKLRDYILKKSRA
ncbi:thiol:disulfide interchange protein (dsbC),putative [Helicobacter bizzozeronii CIII-1]|uniref:Thiol:disulfide interchange protein (DsbC),putative n=2 Tax=Helicobacter bizzozeronii TaxID=56877 RepID=F8KTV8_HELBC|nr:thiol:disulfide interchange protein (dsbC),putative [Helicobacter bizzozeronii CIII-1]